MLDRLPQTVTTSVTLTLSAAGGEADIAAELRYDPADPFAVSLVIGDDPDAVVVWTFARELLQAGVAAPAGGGDITIEPAADRSGRAMIRITLATDCVATMLLARDGAVEFLVESYSLVPSGCELDRIDLDAEIAALLG